MDGRTLTSQPKFFGSIGYQVCLAMEVRGRALPAGSAIITIVCSPNRSRTYDLLVTGSDGLPLSYRRLAGAKAIKGRTITTPNRGGGDFRAARIFFVNISLAEYFFPYARTFFLGYSLCMNFFHSIFPCMNCFFFVLRSPPPPP